MKLKLEVFREISVLSVFGEIDDRSLSTLVIGFKKLTRLKVKYLIVDLTRASLATGTLDTFMRFKPLFMNRTPDFILVGPATELCAYSDIPDALNGCVKHGCREALLVLQKWELELQIENIKAQNERNQGLASSPLSGPERNSELIKLRRETARLKKYHAFLINEVVRQAQRRRNQVRLEKKSDNSEPNHWSEIKEIIIKSLIQSKVLPEEPEQKKVGTS